MRDGSADVFADGVFLEIARRALRAARLADAPYDLVLLDQQMPDLDGLQLVARLQADAPSGAPEDAGDAVAHAILMLSSVNLPGGVQRRKLESDELQMRL